MDSNLKAYIKQISGQASVNQIANKIGMAQTTLAYQWRGNMQPATLAAICRSYNAPILPAFVMAGYLTEEDVDTVTAVRDIKVVSDEELAEEVLRRMKAGHTARLEDAFQGNVQEVDFNRGTDSDYGAELNDSKMVARKIDTPKAGADDSEA